MKVVTLTDRHQQPPYWPVYRAVSILMKIPVGNESLESLVLSDGKLNRSVKKRNLRPEELWHIIMDKDKK